MTHLHPSYPYVRRLLVAAAMMSFAIGPTACKPKVGSQMKAIFSGGKGYALIPARRFTTTGGNGPEFENSIRMMMLPVKCSSESEVVTLENFVLSSQDGARYSGRSILDPNGVPIPGTKSCAVLGNYALHFWAAQYLFPGNPKNDQEYHRQQWVYLALRGPYNKQNQGAKPPAVEKFFEEAGSVRLNGDQSMLGLWDSFFNPCLPLDTAKASRFDKKRHFKCEGTNYRSVSGNPDDATLTTLIANASDSLIYRMANGEFAPVNTAGLEIAIRLYAPTGNALGLTGNTGKSAGKTTAKGRFNGQRQQGQTVRYKARFARFGPARGRQTSNCSAAISGGNVSTNPRPVQNYLRPAPVQANVLTQPIPGQPAAQNPVPGSQPLFYPGEGDPNLVDGRGNPLPPVSYQNDSDRDSASFAQKVDGWKQSEGFLNGSFFGSQPESFQQLKDYSEKSGRPVSDILVSGSPLFNQYNEYELSLLATNPEPLAPVVGMQTINSGEQSELLQGEGYNFDPKFPGWLMKDNGTTQYGMSTNYVGPNGEMNQRTVVNGVTSWYQQDTSGNRGQLLSQINPDGTYSPAGTSSWDGSSQSWVPRTQDPVDPKPPETPATPAPQNTPPTWTIDEELDWRQNNGG